MSAAAPSVHPLAVCESDEVGEGTRVFAFAQVMAGARVGKDCHICGQAFVEAGAVLGDRVTVKNGVMIWRGVVVDDDVFLGPGMTFTNDRFPRSNRPGGPAALRARYRDDGWLVTTRVERGASIGARAIVVPGVTVGHHALVAAGALVTRSVAPHALVAGSPARPVGWVCVCGERLGAVEVGPVSCRCGATATLDAGALTVEPAA